MTHSIRKIRGMYRITFPAYPYFNSNAPTRQDAEAYARRVTQLLK